ncbi:hypothetical protein NVP1193O_080 [Vibrio phage 1.193.O._10N.286.52.C6]|nr:hypothetical protein NVP1193O_080 [Vibrio phage 1.193.O._10N.286.52.C6]
MENKYWLKWSYIYESYIGYGTYEKEVCLESMFVTTEDLDGWWTNFKLDNSDLKKIKLEDVVKL